MGRVWAVAVNTLKQALRMKIAVVFTVLLVVLLPVMALTMSGDGTLKGRLQTFTSYGLSLTSFLLCLLTIFVSIYSVTSDLQQRQIYTVLTKPIRRFELILGKLLGVLLLDILLLLLFSAMIYVAAVNIPKFTGADEAEMARANTEFFTARAALVPEEPDVSAEVQRIYREHEKTGRLPKAITDESLSSQERELARAKYIRQLTEDVKLWKRAAVEGGQIVWRFNDVKPLDPNESIFIRFKYDVSVTPPDRQISARWFIGDDRQTGPVLKSPIYQIDRKDIIRTFNEIEVPANAVAGDGYLAVGFYNPPRLNNTTVIFPPEDGFEVLYRADTFGANYVRCVIVVLLRLVFLACCGLLASTFLSFPVAILLCLLVFFTGTISGFIIESFNYMSEGMSLLYSYTVKPMIEMLPRFDRHNPTKFIVGGRLLGWALLAKIGGIMVGLKAFFLLLLAILIFTYKEIAKIVI